MHILSDLLLAKISFVCDAGWLSIGLDPIGGPVCRGWVVPAVGKRSSQFMGVEVAAPVGQN